MKKTEKINDYAKKDDILPNLHGFISLFIMLPWQCQKSWTHIVDISKFPRGMDEQLLKVSEP